MSSLMQMSTNVPLVLTTVIPMLYVPIQLGASIVHAYQVMLKMESFVLVRLHLNYVVSAFAKLNLLVYI